MNEQTTSDNQQSAGGLNAFARPSWICLLLVLVTLAVYWPVRHCEFLNYDDPDYFTANPHVLAGLTPGGVAWAFTTGLTGNWHPLTWLSLMLDAELFGAGPAGPHLTNLLLHLANTVLLFLLLRRLTSATWRSALVAALFALHPLHVESVAWVSERKDVLSAFFALLSLIAYARFVKNKGENSAADHRPLTSRFYWLAWWLFALGLMAKPMLVTLPFVMLLLDWWPLERFAIGDWRPSVRRLMLEKVPFFLLSVASSVITFIAQQKGGAVVTLVRVSLVQRVENALVSYSRYLAKTCWPADLVNLYPYPASWPMGLVIFSALLVAGLSVAAAWLATRRPYVAVGWFWFVGTLVPVIGLVQVGVQSLADRYTYVPLIGVFIILAWGLEEIGARWPAGKSFVAGIAMLLVLALAVRARDQLGYWQNNEILFRHTLALTQNNYVAYNNLGSYLSREGRVTEALDCYLKSLRIYPDDADVLYNLGNTLAKLGDLDGAIRAYRRALELTPNHADIQNNLGLALAARGQLSDALAAFEKALQLNPDFADAHNNLANLLFYRHQFAEAIPHYRAALHSQPDNPQIYSNLADALVRMGQVPEAVQCYQQALRLKPGDPQIEARLRALGVEILN